MANNSSTSPSSPHLLSSLNSLVSHPYISDMFSVASTNAADLPTQSDDPYHQSTSIRYSAVGANSIGVMDSNGFLPGSSVKEDGSLPTGFTEQTVVRLAPCWNWRPHCRFSQDHPDEVVWVNPLFRSKGGHIFLDFGITCTHVVSLTYNTESLSVRFICLNLNSSSVVSFILIPFFFFFSFLFFFIFRSFCLH